MVIVIGASSFIGVYTVDALLEAGYDVLTTGRNPKFKEYFNKKGVQYLHLDILNKEDIKMLPKSDIEACILFAGLLPANDDADLSNTDHAKDYINVNVLGTINVLEYCRVNNISRVISTTSYADVYNYWDKKIEFTEETPRDFNMSGDHCGYIISKNAATDFLIYYNNQYKMKNIVFRLPPVYGVGPHGKLKENGVIRTSGIQTFIDNAKKGMPIYVYGDKEASRDIVYVKDVASAVVKAIKSNNAEGVFNIGSGNPVTLEEQAKVIADVFSKKKINIINCIEKDNHIKSYCMSIQKARDVFGYIPQYDSFILIMKDWKMEEERGVYTAIFNN